MRLTLLDGKIHIAALDGRFYVERLDLAEADLGFTFTLPEAMVALLYDQQAAEVCFCDDKGNAHPREGRDPYAQGDAAIAALDRLLEAKRVRETHVPTQQELDRQARLLAMSDEANLDTFIDRLRAATPQQIKDFVQANVTDLASAKLFITKLAIAVAFALHGGSSK